MSYGRQYARSGDIFASIDDVIQFGVTRAVSDSDDEHELTPAFVFFDCYMSSTVSDQSSNDNIL